MKNRSLRSKQFLEEQAIANKKLSEEQIAKVKELLENATSQLESIKTDLSEKVHTENVKCYRNIQDLFNEFDSKIEKMDEMEGGVDSVKGYVKLLSWFSILNFVVLIIFIFILYGSISLLMVYNMTPALPASVSFFFKIRKVNFAAIYIIAANF